MVKVNEKITALELRVIDENGENLGVLSLSDALILARERDMDLIEIGPAVKPPIAKIMSFDKYRYIEEKKLKSKRTLQKNQELKQVQISARAAEHDLLIKAKRVNEFLAEGRMVEIMMVLRGREKANRDWARRKLEDFLKIIDTEHKVILPPKSGMRGFVTQIIKK